MGVYIKGMEMPKMPDSIGQGEKIPYIDVRIFADGDAVVTKGTRPYYDKYAAVPVQPHGRLIDADALRSKFREPNKENGGWRNPDEALVHKMDVWAAIDAAPTIIAAEEGE